MKKITNKQRQRDVIRSLKHRTLRSVELESRSSGEETHSKRGAVDWVRSNRWVDYAKSKGLPISVNKKTQGVTIVLPETMNFSSHYEETARIMMAMRRLSKAPRAVKKAYKLASVDFSYLRNISSSAALVLTAELSNWEDNCPSSLKKNDTWDPDIQERFIELGFFDLFKNNPFKDRNEVSNASIRHVRYIKGVSANTSAHRSLRASLKEIVGEDIKKYTFLKSGLDEAITNVGHHAYPDIPEDKTLHACEGKYWYLTGGYDTKTRYLKVSFYDQGVGIPNTLPNSTLFERATAFLSKFPLVDQKNDELLITAAMKAGRTSTGEDDRGEGLNDFLTFIKERQDGYLSILSRKGLYKYSIEDGRVKEKSERLTLPIEGTLIIWRTKLG